MATVTQNLLAPSRPLSWFQDFLKQELAPYPGRTGTVVRMMIAATLVMIICMTFRIPYSFQAAIFALLISRENFRSTLESGGILLLVTSIGAIYILIFVWFVISVPLLHFLWIVGSFFLAFYVISTMTSYAAASTFAIMVSVGVPLWDRHVSAGTNVEDTLWLTLATLIGAVVTTAVELAFSRVKPGDNIVVPLAERLAAVKSLLAACADNQAFDDATKNKVIRFELLGTSRMRRILARSSYSPQYKAQMGSVIALVGRLVDIVAILAQLAVRPALVDDNQLCRLADAIARIRTDLIERRIPGPIQFNANDESNQRVPMLRELERVVTLIPEAFADSRLTEEEVPFSEGTSQWKVFADDAFVNLGHLKFALKGCLAATACYVIYNAIDWPGISTAVTTCLLTALSTIGASRQKQVLRFAGAVVGGFVIGMGSQIFILPHLDTITGFTILFILVTAASSWVMTSSPRLSYFGLQMALAFYLINLQEFTMQTSLSIARDRVVGILFGLFIMWLVFDQLWGTRAALEMKKTFIANLRLLAQLAREPLAGRASDWRSDSLCETISTNFNNVRSLSDGVAFELGPFRAQDLALRNRIRQLQPPLRTFLVTQIALLKYRFQLPGFELPEAVRAAQRKFDEHLAKALEDMADRLEGKAVERKDNLEDAFRELQNSVHSCCSEAPQHLLAPELRTLLTLSHNIENVTLSVNNEI
jgi:multidrug resistance protein MdtO